MFRPRPTTCAPIYPYGNVPTGPLEADYVTSEADFNSRERRDTGRRMLAERRVSERRDDQRREQNMWVPAERREAERRDGERRAGDERRHVDDRRTR